MISIEYIEDKGWFKVTMPDGRTRNYGSLNALLGFITDYYKGKAK